MGAHERLVGGGRGARLERLPERRRRLAGGTDVFVGDEPADAEPKAEPEPKPEPKPEPAPAEEKPKKPELLDVDPPAPKAPPTIEGA